MKAEDLHRVWALLEIVEKCAGHSGKLSAISNAATRELLDMNEDIRQEAMANRVVAPPPRDAEPAEEDVEIDPTDTSPTLADRRI